MDVLFWVTGISLILNVVLIGAICRQAEVIRTKTGIVGRLNEMMARRDSYFNEIESMTHELREEENHDRRTIEITETKNPTNGAAESADMCSN